MCLQARLALEEQGTTFAEGQKEYTSSFFLFFFLFPSISGQ